MALLSSRQDLQSDNAVLLLVNAFRRFEVDDPLGDVDGVVADALEEAGDEEQLRQAFLARCLMRDEVGQRVERVLENVIHLLVHLAHVVGELDVLVAVGFDGHAQHIDGALAQHLDPAQALGVKRHLDGGYRLGDIKGVVADALDVR